MRVRLKPTEFEAWLIRDILRAQQKDASQYMPKLVKQAIKGAAPLITVDTTADTVTINTATPVTSSNGVLLMDANGDFTIVSRSAFKATYEGVPSVAEFD